MMMKLMTKTMMAEKTSILVTRIINLQSPVFVQFHIHFNLPNMFNLFNNITSYHVSNQSQEGDVPKHSETSSNDANFDSYPRKEGVH